MLSKNQYRSGEIKCREIIDFPRRNFSITRVPRGKKNTLPVNQIDARENVPIFALN